MRDQYQLSDQSTFKALLEAGDSQTNCRVLGYSGFNSEGERHIYQLKAGKTNRPNDKVCSFDRFHLEHWDKDCYVTPNQFWRWKNTKQLCRLHANWLEIDTTSHLVVEPDRETEIVSEVFSQLEANGCPPPTGYVCSGSGGIHLYWIYRGVKAYPAVVRRWRAVSKKLAECLTGGENWHLDFAPGNNPACFMRLPGTLHTKSKTFARFFKGGPRYEFDELAGGMGVSVEKKTKSGGSKPAAPGLAWDHQHYQPRQGRHTIREWWTKNYWYICKHFRQHGVLPPRGGDGTKLKGQRDQVLFILFVALKHMHNEVDDAIEGVKRLNNEFIHLSDQEVDRYLQSAIKTDYRYSKPTLATYLAALGVDVGFLYENERPTLSEEECSARRAAGALMTANQKSTKTLTLLTDTYSLFNLNHGRVPRQRELAELSTVSMSTVKRRWREIKAAHDEIGRDAEFSTNKHQGVISPRSNYSPP